MRYSADSQHEFAFRYYPGAPGPLRCGYRRAGPAIGEPAARTRYENRKLTRTITLPDNFIGKEDRARIESFGGHTIARGRATRWHRGRNADGDDLFGIYRGGADETLAAKIYRDRKKDVFCATDGGGTPIDSGSLEQIMATLEDYFMRLHGELPDAPEWRRRFDNDGPFLRPARHPRSQ